MNSPSEMLQAIHQMVDSLPEQLSATLENFQQPDLGNFSELDAPGLSSSTDQSAPAIDSSFTDSSFPALPGFTGTDSTSLTSSQYQESQMADQLREIQEGIRSLSGAKPSGFQRSGGPVQVTGQRSYVGDQEEDFPQASPSVDRSNIAGISGAGGHGYGSAFSVKSFLGGGSKSEQDRYLEHGR